ncbi:MAG: NifU family protein [Alphaproteobacteria bacterium]|nr:NifU family protein [Alphaproteobacteria bacterium]
MFIQTEQTPNPATLKFIPGVQVMARGTADFPSPEGAERSPLAQTLFDVSGVRAVFFGSDFVTVSKDDAHDWQVLKPMILGAIMDHFMAGRPVLLNVDDDNDEGAEDSEVVSQIKELLETRVRPAVAQDGGDIVFRAFEDGVVYLSMQGACAGCPSSTATLKMGVENMLRHYISEVEAVYPVP